MATYTIARGALAAHEKVSGANVVDTVTFGEDIDAVEVLHLSGTAALYFTVDGSTPAIAGASSLVVTAGTALRVEVPTSGATTVKLVSASAVTYSVTRAVR